MFIISLEKILLEKILLVLLNFTNYTERGGIASLIANFYPTISISGNGKINLIPFSSFSPSLIKILSLKCQGQTK
jgi:hypothetical protein